MSNETPECVLRSTFEFSQEEDSGGRPGAIGQQMKVVVEDAGGGAYPVLETERWALDKAGSLEGVLGAIMDAHGRLGAQIDELLRPDDTPDKAEAAE